MKKSSFVILGVLVVSTFFSVALRYQTTFANTVFDYEWHTSTVLRHMQIWDQKGVFAERFVPGVSYVGENNAHIDNHSSVELGRLGYGDTEGNFYYVSYPPFAYIAPYALFKLSGAEPNIVGLRVFNLLTHIATAGILFLLLLRMSKKPAIAAAGYCLYILAPIALYMHGANYMSDMFVQLLFALSAYLFYVLISTQGTLPLKAYVPLAITLFLLAYTEWIGLFVCAFVFIYALSKRKDSHKALPLLAMSVVMPATALLLTIVQYASAGGFDPFITVMLDRYVYGYDATVETLPFLHQLDAILQNYGKWFGSIFLTALIFIAQMLFFRLQSRKGEVMLPPFGPVMLLFIAFPVLAHHVVFFDWTAFDIHFYSVLKTALFFSVLIPMLMYAVRNQVSGKAGVFNKVFIGAVFALCLLGSLVAYVYERDDRIKEYSHAYCDLGKHIKKTTASDEIAFLTPLSEDRFNGIISAVIVLCAERNIALFTDLAKAQELIDLNKATKGRLFTIDYTDNIINLVDEEVIGRDIPSGLKR